MSVNQVKDRLVEILDERGLVSTEDLEDDTVLNAASRRDVQQAAWQLEGQGRAVLLHETMTPEGLDFTGLLPEG